MLTSPQQAKCISGTGLGSWVPSSEENFSGRGDFSLGVNMASDSIP